MDNGGLFADIGFSSSRTILVTSVIESAVFF